MHMHSSDRPDSAQRPAVEGELLTGDEWRAAAIWVGKQNLARLISVWSDTVFEVPGLGWRFGLDPIIGLIPVAGDFASAVVSLYILALAAEMQVPRSTMLRMGLNVAIDYFVGAIPLVGNLFDFAWKANARNMQLLERTMASPPTERRKQSLWDWLILVGLLAALVALFIGSLVIAILIAAWIARLFAR